MTQPLVISYTRFSSRRQAKGTSYQRQIEQAEVWCKKHGHKLDKRYRFKDLGVSAYSGANAENGDLRRLQDMLRSGELPKGTILIVEALDRITRQALPKAINLLMNLATSGLRIVTLSDEKEWNEDVMSDLGAFMMSVVTLYRGHQESAFKSQRLKDGFDIRRRSYDRSAFGSAPGWLSRESKESPWQVDESKAEAVRKVFELAAQGYGSKKIAAVANAEGWPVPTRLNLTDGRWHARMPQIILQNRAVTGEHEHRLRSHEAHAKDWKGAPTGIVRPDYYPRIVSDELWMAARASIETRRFNTKRDVNYYNVFSGLMYCGHCGAPIHRRNETKGYSRATLFCADKLAGITSCPSSAAITADRPILDAIFKHSAGDVRNDGVRLEIAATEADLKEKNLEISRITEAISKVGALDQLTEKLSMLSLEQAIITSSLNTLLALHQTSYLVSDFESDALEQAMEHLYVKSDDSMDYRAQLHLKIARRVETIWIWGYEVALIKYYGGSEPEWVELDFKRLPSRANTMAKWHKPPKPKTPPPRPNLEAAMAKTLVPPNPRKPAEPKQDIRPYIVMDEVPADGGDDA